VDSIDPPGPTLHGSFGSPGSSASRPPACDRFGREIDYLRISVTEACNLGCRYCRPLDGAAGPAPGRRLLTPAEIATVARAAVRLGFRKFRLTGGEPTLRPELVEIVAGLASIPGVADLAMTTNGARLPRLALPLARAGLRRVNVHVDTFHPGRLAGLMRFARPAAVEEAIAAAEAAGLAPVKLNCVVVRWANEEDVVGLARRARDRGAHVRFIELMPVGGGEAAALARARYVPSSETRERIEAALGALVPRRDSDPTSEARAFGFAAGGPGTVGFISPVSAPYCDSCRRMRLTADGRLRPCLLDGAERDVTRALRDGGEDGVAEVLARAIRSKPSGHHLSERGGPEGRTMAAIGG
jgi:cyclic pyranopterin phosphate synthase